MKGSKLRDFKKRCKRIIRIYKRLLKYRKSVEREIQKILKYEKTPLGFLTIYSSLKMLHSFFQIKPFLAWKNPNPKEFEKKLFLLSFLLGLELKTHEAIPIFHKLTPRLEKIVKDFSKLSEEEKRIVTIGLLGEIIKEENMSYLFSIL